MNMIEKNRVRSNKIKNKSENKAVEILSKFENQNLFKKLTKFENTNTIKKLKFLILNTQVDIKYLNKSYINLLVTNFYLLVVLLNK